MRKLFGNLIGGKKGGVRQTVSDLLSELRGDGVSSEVWDQCRNADDLEDCLEDELSRDTLVAVIEKKPENVFEFVKMCVESIEDVVPKEEVDETDENSLANSMIMLTHILAAGPGGPPPEAPSTATILEGSSGHVEVQHPLLRLLWAQNVDAAGNKTSSDTAQPVAERIIDATMRALFLEGFTIDGLEGRKAGQGKEGKDIINGVDVECLWYAHIGPELPAVKGKDVGQQPPDNDMRDNRMLALQLLLTTLCGGAPSVILKEEEAEARAEKAAPPARGRASSGTKEAKKPREEVAAEAEPSILKPLITDTRFLNYMQDAGRIVPWRLELLLSLLSLALDYDPGGLRMPFSGANKEQEYVAVALQVLVLLLQCGADTNTNADSAVVSTKPQELAGTDEAEVSSPSENAFRCALLDLSSERDVEFIAGGIATLLGTVSEGGSSYLPGSSRMLPFLTELLVLVFHLAGSRDFVKGLCCREFENVDIAQLIESVVHVMFQASEHVKEDDLIAVGLATLMRLTSYRDVCDKLNEEYDGDIPDSLPDFKGTHADLVALAAVKHAGDFLGSVQVNSLHRCIVEASLSTLTNVSTFAEGLCTPVCFRMFALLERCGKTANLSKGRTGIGRYLPRVLEGFQNAVQYQYSSNLDMVYGLLTRQALLTELASVADEKVNSSVTSADGELPLEWWEEVKVRLRPVMALIDRVAPILEAEVEKREIRSSDEAKKFMPRTALGLLPVPHAFCLRSIRDNAIMHRSCERCLVACVAHGPAGDLWEVDEENGTSDAADEALSAKAKENGGERKRGSSRTRSSSRNRSRKGDDTKSGLTSGSRPPRSDSGGRKPTGTTPVAPPVLTGTLPDLQAQLQAAAASGVDINALVAALAAQQAAAQQPTTQPTPLATEQQPPPPATSEVEKTEEVSAPTPAVEIAPEKEPKAPEATEPVQATSL